MAGVTGPPTRPALGGSDGSEPKSSSPFCLDSSDWISNLSERRRQRHRRCQASQSLTVPNSITPCIVSRARNAHRV